MTSRDVIENKISSTRKFLGLLDRYRGYSPGQNTSKSKNKVTSRAQ
jgi:hypothetical protein